MKKILLSLLAVLFIGFSAQAQEEGDLVFGAGINLFDIGDAIGIQGKGVYGINEQFAVGGAFTYWLDDGIDFEIDATAFYKGLDVSESFKLYPAAGLSYLKSPSVAIPIPGLKISASTTSIHIGAEFRFVLQSGMTIYAQPLLLLESGSPINISGGILF